MTGLVVDSVHLIYVARLYGVLTCIAYPKCKKWQLFLSVVVLWFCCRCERSKIILGETFSDMCCLDNAKDRRCDCWMREEDVLKKGG